jgi:uncharacterized protein (TIGR03083 family)
MDPVPPPLIRVEDLPRIPHADAIELGRSQGEAFIADLRALEPEDWNALTDCAPWTVKDVAAHALGWPEAVLSPKEMYHQMRSSISIRKEWDNIVDAQNAVQVRERRTLSTDELLARLEASLPRFNKVRDRLGRVLKPIPTYNGLLGFVSLGFVAETIFTRDLFMHRIDIANATGGTMSEGPREARILGDCLKEWGRASKAQVHVHLSGGAGGDYSVGDRARASITARATDLARMLAGRPRGDSVKIEGEVEAALSWLAIGCRF